MPRGDHKNSLFWTAAIFIALEVAAIAMLQSSTILQNIWINRFSHSVMAELWGGAQKAADYLSLKKTNELLMEENAQLSSRLLSCLNPPQDSVAAIDSTFSYLHAHIVKMSTNTLHNYIILDKGSRDGVEPDCGIVTSKGVVGTISAVSERYSYGITLMNPKLSVSAKIGRNGLVAPLYWDGKNTDGAILDGVPMKYELNRGDTIWTSGFSTLYPSGIPLGTVSSTKIVNGTTNRAQISLFEDFASLSHVLIVRNNEISQIRELENSGEAVK